MATIKYPFGSLPVQTVDEDPDNANQYPYTFNGDAIIYVKGSALTIDSTVILTAGAGARPGNILAIRWLSNVAARDITVKPLIGTNGQKFDATAASKQSSLTLMYTGTDFIPIGFIPSIEVA